MHVLIIRLIHSELEVSVGYVFRDNWSYIGYFTNRIFNPSGQNKKLNILYAKK